MLEEGWVEPREVPVPGRSSGKGITRRFVQVIGVMFGENAHPELVEGGVLQGLKRLLLQRVLLVSPGVAGGSDRPIRGAVVVAEVERVPDPDQTVVVRRRGPTSNSPRLPSSSGRLLCVTYRQRPWEWGR